MWSIARVPVNDLHPTMKPVELVERAIANSSRPGETVLDAFGGSGTTVIACEKTGRRGRLIELDPQYVDVIVRRWQKYTGMRPTLDGSGKTFLEVEQERLGAQRRLFGAGHGRSGATSRVTARIILLNIGPHQ